MDSGTVTLGAHDYTVVAQPHAVILRKLPKVVTGTTDLGGLDPDTTPAGLVTLLGERAYDALKLFIPNLMPRYEFHGFRSQEVFDADTNGDDSGWDEEYALEHAPTLPQMFNAFDVAIEVNGGKRLKDLLGNVLGPEVTRAIRSFVVAQMRVRLSEMSQNLPSPSDGSDPSTSSTTNGATSEVLETTAHEV